MARKKKPPEHVNHERWLVSYADFITLLFAFFVVMFASSQVDTKKMGQFSDSFSKAIGESFLMEGGRSLLPDGKPPPPEPPGAGGTGAEGTLPKELVKLAKKLGQNHDELAGLKILQRRNELVIRLADSLLFDSGDDTLKEHAVRVVQAIANELRERKVDVRVEGHTDDVPIRTMRYRSNWDLSTARATAVIAQLNGPGRIPATRLAASGYGEFRPVASNATPEGRAQNRRVDLVIAASLDMPADEIEAPGAASASASAAPTAVIIGPPLPPEDPAAPGANEHADAPPEHAGAAPSAKPAAAHDEPSGPSLAAPATGGRTAPSAAPYARPPSSPHAASPGPSAPPPQASAPPPPGPEIGMRH
jgi:chemotaxis protein MotB